MKHLSQLRWIGLLGLVLCCCLPQSAAAQNASIYIRFFKKAPPAAKAKYLALVAKFGTEEELGWLLDQTLDPSEFPEMQREELQLKALEGLAEAAVNQKKRPVGELERMSPLLASKSQAVRLAAFQLIGLWKLQSLAEPLQTAALTSSSQPKIQQAALAALDALGGAAAQSTFEKMTAPDQPFANQQLGVAGLAGLNLEQAAQKAAQLLSGAELTEPPGVLLQGFLDQQQGSQKLAAALADKEISQDLAKLMLRYLYSIGRSDEELVALLNDRGGISEALRPLDRDELLALAKEVQTKGDPHRGEEIFRRSDLSCFKCHALSGAGGKVGPELSAVGGSSPVEYIITSIMFPSQDIKEAFLTRRIYTLQGKIYQGIVVDRDDRRLILRDASGVESSIAVNDIDEELEGKSLMPQGLPNLMTRVEFLDLAAFISQLGKPGEFAVRNEPTIQRWRVLREVPAELAAPEPDSAALSEHLFGADEAAWEPAYARAAGALPLQPLGRPGQTVLYLYGEVEAAIGGPAMLALDSPDGITAWLDDQPIEIGKPFELSTGRHRLILRVDAARRAAATLRAVVKKPEGSPADYQVVGGP